MKLISLNTLLISFAVTIYGQKYQQEQFQFPPQFQSTSSSFSSDNSLYLPLESQTPIPYFAMNGINKLPFPFLPSTGTKIPPMYPTQLPIYLSSTLRFEDEENENDHNEKSTVIISKPLPQSLVNRPNNNTVTITSEKKDGRFMSRMPNQQLPLQKFEIKPPAHTTVKPNEIPQPKGQNSASRRMIITSEIQRSDQNPEQIKGSNSFQNPHFVQAPGIFISSTTEPAIPILRLSNEMDLDGSFSYEALGADQTHYVQHSRMENMGNDKEEQVVEGSYSYVGDDGRTYTVHYIADSNGFRATGDHLPVPPPIPEIIQRSVQYNLAEEAKKPPHLRTSWESEDYEINDRNNYNSQPQQRNLFTGKTPEAFSFGFSQGSNSQNNLVTAASFAVPTKVNYDISTDQSKAKVNPMPISPQVTFLASQGTHNPSTQTQTPTKITLVEKSPLPQLMNYEAEIKDSDQDANKALWRWQYGLSSNINQNRKNSISRSFSEGDDVIINFSDMTPEQYTQMMQTRILPQNSDSLNNDKYNDKIYESSTPSKILDNKDLNISQPYIFSALNNDFYSQQPETKTPVNTNYNFQEETYKQEDKSNTKNENPSIHSNIISRHSFIPQSQIATQSYTFDDTPFESSKIANENLNVNLRPIYSLPTNDLLSINNTESDNTVEPIFKTLKSDNAVNFVDGEENSSFRPMIYHSERETKQDTTTTEASINVKIRENIFLKKIFNPSNDNEQLTNKQIIENHSNENKEIKQDKESNHYHFKGEPHNEVKYVKSKPLDVNEFLNFIVMKNHFESVKTKQKTKPVQQSNQNGILKDMSKHYIPIKENINYDVEPNDSVQQMENNDYRSLNRQQQQELQGLIKNYKVLQRQKNSMQRSQLLSEPQRNIKAFHSQNLPPLGRAGPSMKTYLPPTYL